MSRNLFAGPYLDRATQRRADPDWQERARRDPRSQLVPVWRGLNLLAGDPPSPLLLPMSAAVEAGLEPADGIFLGLRGTSAVYALGLPAEEAPPAIFNAGRFQSLRQLAGLLSPEDAGLLAYAKAMAGWHENHRYCGRSGQLNVASEGGHVLVGAQGHKQFPRVDPAVIVLVSRGDRCLLGRQPHWPAGRYSAIAGFVEPGESLEDAVAREVREETNIALAEIRYHSSQPWPFPASLMVGFRARAEDGDIRLNDGELAEAAWFSAGDIAAPGIRLPPSTSISFRLIQDWLEKGG